MSKEFDDWFYSGERLTNPSTLKEAFEAGKQITFDKMAHEYTELEHKCYKLRAALEKIIFYDKFGSVDTPSSYVFAEQALKEFGDLNENAEELAKKAFSAGRESVLKQIPSRGLFITNLRNSDWDDFYVWLKKTLMGDNE